MKYIYLKTIALVSIFILSAIVAKAQQNDDLLNVLIKKNVISQQEADSLRSDQALKEQQ
ncbi:MAG: hypothetical protein JWR67_2225, partial [Mucilaginibacter sp.]|nr:hypothetical protein [Mucilaginibacter sp.]